MVLSQSKLGSFQPIRRSNSIKSGEEIPLFMLCYFTRESKELLFLINVVGLSRNTSGLCFMGVPYLPLR